MHLEVPRRPLPGCGGSVRGLLLLSSGWMRGCPCRVLSGFCTPWGLLHCTADSALITEDNSCQTYTLYFACSCTKQTHTHAFTQSHAYHTVAVLSCGFKPSVSTVMLYVLAAGAVAACVFCFVLFCFLSVCLIPVPQFHLH